MLGRVLLASDFQRVLRTPPRGRSEHFLVHHLPQSPGRKVRGPVNEPVDKLSTGGSQVGGQPVDDCWFGWVVPKRFARRSVTRNLIRRQMRESATCHRGELPRGLWVLRLHRGFDVGLFPSAASVQLRSASRGELDRLLARMALPDARAPRAPAAASAP